MSYTIVDVEQGTPAWYASRVGRVTSSRAEDATATPTRRGITELKARIDYRNQLVAERLTGQPQGKEFTAKDTDRGHELEPLALAAYEAHSGNWVSRVGFLSHNELMAGASPDGMVERVGIVEIKAPRPVTHLGYLRSGGIPSEYQAQCLHLLWVSSAEWLDFVSFCPPLPDHLRLHVVRMQADAAALAEYDEKVRAFLASVDIEVSALFPIEHALRMSLGVA